MTGPELNRLIEPRMVGRASADRLWERNPSMRDAPIKWPSEMVEEMARDGFTPEQVLAIQREAQMRWEELQRRDRIVDRIVTGVVAALLLAPGLVALLVGGPGWPRVVAAIATLLQWSPFFVAIVASPDD